MGFAPRYAFALDHFLANRSEWFPTIKVVERVAAREEFVESRKEVVAAHDSDPPHDAGFREDVLGLNGARQRVHTARVRNHLQLLCLQLGERRASTSNEVGGESGVRIFRLLNGEDRHRDSARYSSVR